MAGGGESGAGAGSGCPRLAAALDAAGVVPVLFAASWLLTGFAADFPIGFAARYPPALAVRPLWGAVADAAIGSMATVVLL
jgi:hypothetical protein